MRGKLIVLSGHRTIIPVVPSVGILYVLFNTLYLRTAFVCVLEGRGGTALFYHFVVLHFTTAIYSIERTRFRLVGGS